MSSKPSEQSYSQIKWRKTSYGMQIGKAAGFAFQVREMGEGGWTARMKIWSVGARFETVAEGLASMEDAMEQCDGAYLVAREHFASVSATPQLNPEPMPAPRRSSPVRQAVGTETLVAEAEAEAPQRRARQTPVQEEIQEEFHGNAQEEICEEVTYQESTCQEPVTQEPEAQNPVNDEPVMDVSAISSQYEEMIEELIMERDRAVAAFHAALCRNPGVIPSRYNDLFQDDHFEILEFKAKSEDSKEPVASKRKKVAEPVG